jgi:SAM-dependent methyltransferase
MMTVTEDFDPAVLKRHYGPDYFQGAEYVDYVGDRNVHLKTLSAHLRLVQCYVPRGGRILEIGCAHGFFLELIRELYPRSVGVDLSEAAVAEACKRNLDARAGDLSEMNFPDPFDAVCLWDTIEHLPRPFEVIQCASQLLKPGGCLFLTTGDFGAWLARWRGLKWRQIHPPTHLFYFTRSSLQKLSAKVGLKVDRFGTVTVYRRLGSAFQALERFRGDSLGGRLARIGLRAVPKGILDWGIPLNLGDTLYLAARKL